MIKVVIEWERDENFFWTSRLEANKILKGKIIKDVNNAKIWKRIKKKF